MKTRNYYAIAVVVLLASFSACRKAEPVPEENAAPEQLAGKLVTFTASLEAPAAPDTRMTIVDGEGASRIPAWEEGDKIKIFYKDPTTQEMTSVEGTADAAGAQTTFTATIPDGVTSFYAVYPATLNSSVDADGNFSVPTKASDSDEVTFKNACICIAKCGSDRSFQFKNLCSVLKFTVETRGNVMKVLSLDATPLTGTVHASLNSTGEVVYASEPYTSTAYTRVFKALPSGAANTVCYMPILPGTQAAGIAIDCKNETGKPALFARISLPFERSHIYNLGTVDSKMVTDYYITVDGAGAKDGKSWESAGDVNTFKSLVGIVAGDPSESAAVKCGRYAQIWMLKGATFHFGAGTYILGDASNDRLTIDFNGANGSLYAPFTIQGADLDADGNPTTIFSGNDTYGILNVFDRARVHINNVTFAHAYNKVATADDTKPDETNLGAALYLKAKGCSSIKASPRVWLSHCVFDSNKTDHTASTHVFEGGSAINLVHGAVYADHCIFKNNVDTKRSGPIKLSGKEGYVNYPAYAFFNACLFTGNDVQTANAGQASGIIRQNRKGGLLGLYNCTFYGNAGSNKSRHILNLDNASIVANCTFVEEFNGNTSYPIRLRGDAVDGKNHFILANNIFMHTEATTAANNVSISLAKPSSGSRSIFKLYMEGGNLFGSTTGTYYTDGTHTVKTDANEFSGFTYGDIDNGSFSDNVFKWAGTLSSNTVTPAFMSEETMVNNVLKSSNVNEDGSDFFSTTGSEGAETYAGFYTWLNSLGAIGVDALGNTRPATGWMPGAYQVPVAAE